MRSDRCRGSRRKQALTTQTLWSYNNNTLLPPLQHHNNTLNMDPILFHMRTHGRAPNAGRRRGGVWASALPVKLYPAPKIDTTTTAPSKRSSAKCPPTINDFVPNKRQRTSPFVEPRPTGLEAEEQSIERKQSIVSISSLSTECDTGRMREHTREEKMEKAKQRKHVKKAQQSVLLQFSSQHVMSCHGKDKTHFSTKIGRRRPVHGPKAQLATIAEEPDIEEIETATSGENDATVDTLLCDEPIDDGGDDISLGADGNEGNDDDNA